MSPHIEDASGCALLVPTYFGAPFAQITCALALGKILVAPTFVVDASARAARLYIDRWVAVLAGESDAWPC